MLANVGAEGLHRCEPVVLSHRFRSLRRGLLLRLRRWVRDTACYRVKA